MTKVYFNENPDGFTNNFIRSLHKAISGQVELVDSISGDYDVLFLNEFKTGNRMDAVYEKFHDWYEKYMEIKNQGKKLVVRAINLKQHSLQYGFLFKKKDRIKIKLLNAADVVIFQSQYQKDFFVKYGYKGEGVVIHNGADDRYFNTQGHIKWNGKEELRVISCSMSAHPVKKHNLIADFSEYVQVSHIGRWPDNLDKKNVKMLGMLTQEQVAEEMKKSHVFLHPAIKDVCPSVIMEATCCGLPVIYNDKIGSSKEIVFSTGVPLRKPGETIEKIKNVYEKLTDRIEEVKSYYSITRTANQYTEEICTVAAM